MISIMTFWQVKQVQAFYNVVLTHTQMWHVHLGGIIRTPLHPFRNVLIHQLNVDLD